MKEVFDAVHSSSLPRADLHFSCVNLSYDYDDRANQVDLQELDRTARILMGFVESTLVPQAGVPDDFKKLVFDIVKTPNPQYDSGGKAGEAELMGVIGAWFLNRRIRFEADTR